MNYVSTENTGIDYIINDVQRELYDLLIERWVDDISGYGRVYRNKNNEGKVYLERYVGVGDYQDVYYDDHESGNFFFLDSEIKRSKDSLVFNSLVRCVFMVDLSKILPSSTHRADETAQRDAIEMLRSIADERYTITGIEVGVSKIFVNIQRDRLKFADIHPFHVFAVLLDMNYYINDKCE